MALNLDLYPEEPGVYLMKNREGQLLYIGKAKNLKSRVQNYFSSAGDGRPMVPYLMAQVEQIETIVTLTEKDALILESQLIKRHQPKYNVLLKDDKSFIGLVITNHRWPMLRVVRYRDKPKESGLYFGPYPSAAAARATLELMAQLFPLRQCSDAEFARRKRPCLLYDTKRCCAPCVDRCSKPEYDSYVEAATSFLRGHIKDIVQRLRQEMEAASEALEFERADSLLRAIRQIEYVTKRPSVDYPGNCDVIGLYREADMVTIVHLICRDNNLLATERFTFPKLAADDPDALESFLIQHYGHSPSIPEEILLPIHLPRQQAIEEILSEAAGRPIALLCATKKPQKRLLEMAHANAQSFFRQEQERVGLREQQLLDLQESLQLTRFPRRIDCFDTSHISGTNAVASLVSFVDGEPDPSRSRLFIIPEKAEDYYAMRQAMQRYFAKQTDLCDLLVVDGGKGQLSCAIDVLNEFGIASVDLIALAKEDSLHTQGLTRERIFFPDRKEPLTLEARSPALFLLQTIRDEAHRRAIQFHQKRRSRTTFTSALDEIPGIGPIKKRALLKRFGSVQGVQRATPQELEQVAELNRKDLDAIEHWKDGKI